ncbi:hypothetical protein ACFQJC_14520 [Haloferax namakaokahaiae]|uniref:Uncharacterized protein n=1 Tax=Haloferax namakaokahaiae TaxID=1748331 RepID=A0ABD5ZI79_9EURY
MLESPNYYWDDLDPFMQWYILFWVVVLLYLAVDSALSPAPTRGPPNGDIVTVNVDSQNQNWEES